MNIIYKQELDQAGDVILGLGEDYHTKLDGLSENVVLKGIEYSSPHHGELLPELKTYLEPYPRDGYYMIRHPLVLAAPYFPESTALVNDTYRRKAAAVREAWAEEDYATYLGLHEKPFRVAVLTEIAPCLSGPEYWQLVSDTWLMSETVWGRRRAWRKLWLSEKPHREAVMKCEDRDYLASLPDVLTIYRGVHLRAAIHGLSWTLRREQAEWFAQWRLEKRRRPMVVKTKVPKTLVLAYFSERQEDEIVVHPDVIRSLPITTDRVS